MIDRSQYNPDVLTCLANLSNDEVFTPPNTTNQILDLLPSDIWSDEKSTFLDPVCKSGVFLREITKRLIVGLESKIPNIEERLQHIFSNQIYGMPITELTGMISRRSVYCSKHANGKFSLAANFNDNSGNIVHFQSQHSWVRGKCKYCGASESNFSRSAEFETYAYDFIHPNKSTEIWNMKFDVIVGNPPYQLKDGGFGTSATSIYNLFVEQAKSLNPRYISMVIPARWFSGGKGMDDFRNSMLTDDRIREIHDFPDATRVFPGVQIKGGVRYFLWSRDERGDCKVVNYDDNGVKSSSTRPLLESNATSFVRFNEAIPILNKVQKFEEKTFETEVSSRKPFGLPTNFKGSAVKTATSVKLFQNGGVGYIDRNEISKNVGMIDKWKVFIPRAGSGSDSFPHPILGEPFVGEPGTACTETYMVASIVESQEEAENLIGYIRTRLFRFLVLLHKPSQDASSKVYKFVPQQALQTNWTDEVLYNKYDITADEQNFIASLIREI